MLNTNDVKTTVMLYEIDGDKRSTSNSSQTTATRNKG